MHCRHLAGQQSFVLRLRLLLGNQSAMLLAELVDMPTDVLCCCKPVLTVLSFVESAVLPAAVLFAEASADLTTGIVRAIGTAAPVQPHNPAY